MVVRLRFKNLLASCSCGGYEESVNHECGEISTWNVNDVSEFYCLTDSSLSDCTRARCGYLSENDMFVSAYDFDRIGQNVAETCLNCTFRGPQWLPRRVASGYRQIISPCGDVIVGQQVLFEARFCADVPKCGSFAAQRLYFQGDISRWNVQQVTNMREAFSGLVLFKGTGLSNWNISRVNSFEGTFEQSIALDDCVRARVYDRWSSNLDFEYNITWVGTNVASDCLGCTFHGPRWLSHRIWNGSRMVAHRVCTRVGCESSYEHGKSVLR